MSQTKEFYSKNVAEAIRLACAEFATSQENLSIEVLATGSAGIFGLCRKRAHIRVGLKKTSGAGIAEQDVQENVPQAEKSAEAKSVSEPECNKPRPEKKRTPLKEKAPVAAAAERAVEPPTDEALESIRSNLTQFLSLMGLDSDVTSSFDGGNVQCQISGDHEESIVGSEGKTLDSMQYLLRKMKSRTLPDRVSIDLDCGNFRERRIEELKKIVVELAEKVKEDGKTLAIPALNPSERRVVHVTLQEDKGVRSRSVGDGLFKKVLIYKPGKPRKKSGSRRRGRAGGKPSE